MRTFDLNQATIFADFPQRALSQAAGVRMLASLDFMAGKRVRTSVRYSRTSILRRRQFSTMV